MLRFITYVAAVLSFATIARAQGPAHFSWHDAPTDVRAIAAANIVTLCANPLGTGLASLATGTPVDPNGAGAAAPLAFNPAHPGISHGLGGGTIPQDFFKPQPSHAAGAASNAGGGGSTGGASNAASQPMWEQGFWEVGGGEPHAVYPDGVPVNTGTPVPNTFDTPEPGTLVLGGIGLLCIAARRRRARWVTSTQQPSEFV